jgi:hypothetical protein
MDYQLNTNAAKDADKFSIRIDSKGRYFGTFTRAEKITSTKGTRGIDFSFRDESGATADYLTIWTHNGDGKELHGFKVLNAIMTVLRVKSMTAENGEVEKYENGKRIKTTVPLFKEMIGKQIGLLMYMEEYAKKDGSTNWKPAIAAPFDANHFTAGEILSQAKKAETLDKMEAAIKDRPLRVTTTQQSNSSAPDIPNSFSDFVDDIPF